MNRQGTLGDFFDTTGGGSGTALEPRKKQAYTSKRLQELVSEHRKAQKQRNEREPSAGPSNGNMDEDTNTNNGDEIGEQTGKKRKKAGETGPRKRKAGVKAATSPADDEVVTDGPSTSTTKTGGRGRGARRARGAASARGRGRGGRGQGKTSTDERENDNESSEGEFEPSGQNEIGPSRAMSLRTRSAKATPKETRNGADEASGDDMGDSDAYSDGNP